jgi:hypothetical protein
MTDYHLFSKMQASAKKSGWYMVAIMAAVSVPFPAPPGWTWVFCTRFYHWRAKRYLYAKNYGKQAWCFLVRARR